MKWFLLFFENLNRDFGILGIGIVQIGLQIWTLRHRIRLYANVGIFDCIISPKNNQLACFLSLCILYIAFVTGSSFSLLVAWWIFIFYNAFVTGGSFSSLVVWCIFILWDAFLTGSMMNTLILYNVFAIDSSFTLLVVRCIFIL